MCAVKERFVEKPNLPESKVTTAAVSGAYPEILDRVPCRYADVSFG